jgi:hypothetical protein
MARVFSTRGFGKLIIIFNGPPQSGKDQSCDFLKKEMGFSHAFFKKVLIEETINYFGVTYEWFMSTYDQKMPDGTLVKDMRKSELGGRSRRNALIHVSEEVFKPLHGKDYFGVKMAESLNPNLNYCCSDGGFTEEILPIINKLGNENVILVQLTRDGSDFSKDSRRYINGILHSEYVNGHRTEIKENEVLSEKLNLKMYRIHNNGSLDELNETIKKILKEVGTT